MGSQVDGRQQTGNQESDDAKSKERSLAENFCEPNAEADHDTFELLSGFRSRIKILVGAGLYLAHHFAEGFPRIFGVVFESSGGVDTRDIRCPVVAEHLIGIAVA